MRLQQNEYKTKIKLWKIFQILVNVLNLWLVMNLSKYTIKHVRLNHCLQSLSNSISVAIDNSGVSLALNIRKTWEFDWCCCFTFELKIFHFVWADSAHKISIIESFGTYERKLELKFFDRWPCKNVMFLLKSIMKVPIFYNLPRDHVSVFLTMSTIIYKMLLKYTQKSQNLWNILNVLIQLLISTLKLFQISNFY
jgi:hypothetical protein